MTLFHLALPDDWSRAEATGRYPWSTRGRTVAEVGFAHLSHPHQVAATAGRHYADVDEVVLLALEPGALGAPVVDEEVPGGERFPHLYGEIPVASVVRAVPWHRGPGGWGVPPA